MFKYLQRLDRPKVVSGLSSLHVNLQETPFICLCVPAHMFYLRVLFGPALSDKYKEKSE